jgi:predicted dehydrogenase
MDSIKTGVIGTGMIGPLHIEAMRRLSGIEPQVLVGSSEEKARAKADALGVPVALGDWRELIAMEDIQVVHVCTPNHLHFPIVKAAIAAGKHVVCEKPLSNTAEEARELVKLAKSAGIVNAVHFNIRFYPLMRTVHNMVAAGELGEIYDIQGSYLQDWLFYDTDYNWRLEPEYSGESRAIADIGSHWMDLVEYVSGRRVVEVNADFRTVFDKRKKPRQSVETYSSKLTSAAEYDEVPINTEDYATVLLGFDNGARGVVTVSQVAAGRKNRLFFEIHGSKQSVAWESERPNELWIGRRDAPNGVLLKDPGLATGDSGKLMGWPGGHNEGFPDTPKQLFAQVYEHVRTGKPGGIPYPTFEDGLREMVLCETILASSRSRSWTDV